MQATMRILVTGAGGFVGRALLPLLADDNDLIALDSRLGTIPGAAIEGDLRDPAVRRAAAELEPEALIHLATMPGGAAEDDPAGAWSVNVEATVQLVEMLAARRRGLRVVFASSIAVFGSPLPGRVDHDTPLRPQLHYGAHKAMIETWLGTLARRGGISALSLRLPGIVARPRGPAGMKSAFMSELFHAALAGIPFVSPISPDATMWVMSVDAVARNLAHALTVKAPEPFALTLPAVRTRMDDLVEEVCLQTGAAADRFSYAPDLALEADFGRYPPLETPLAEALGFTCDGGVPQLVTAALDRIREEAR